MTDHPIELFVPPRITRRAPPEPSVLPPLVPEEPDSPLCLGIAAVDRSGRLRERALLAVLGWMPGDRTTLEVQPHMMILRRTGDGPLLIDDRGQLFLPAATRTLFGIGIGDRVVLVAAPQAGLLIIHPATAVASLLADFYDTVPGGPDVRRPRTP